MKNNKLTIYYFEKGEESGAIHKAEFNNQAEAEKWLKFYNESIEIFEIKK